MKRLVIKIGSNIIAGGDEGLDTGAIERLSGEIASLSQSGFDVVVVSSGAVAAGMKKLALSRKPREIQLKQAAAAVGQSSLMWAYERAFSRHSTKVAQILLTQDTFSARKTYINAKNTLSTLLSYKIIPVINENDTVATDEIRFGDNDNLAALVAILIEAERLIILSDVDGLYDRDPSSASANLIRIVESVTTEILGYAGTAKSAIGTGGMYSKVLAARTAASHGITVQILNGRKTGSLKNMFHGEQSGTLFLPEKTRLSQRKGWIAHHSRASGSLRLDEGAVKALISMGRSLLPSGIVGVEGDFDVGDFVYCLNAQGQRVAKGLSNYSSRDVRAIMGRKTKEIEAVLGYKYSDEVIHRDNLVLL